MDADKFMMMGYQKFKHLGLAEVWEVPAIEKSDIVARLTVTEELTALKSRVEQLKGQLAYKWAWKTVAPLASQAQSKQVGTKTYHWCPNHIKWCIHMPVECKGLTKNDFPATSVPGAWSSFYDNGQYTTY
jgi:hypothetical protein